MPDWFPKRLVVFVLTSLGIALNNKLGLGMGPVEIAGLAGAGATYLATQTAHDLGLAKLGRGKHAAPAKAP